MKTPFLIASHHFEILSKTDLIVPQLTQEELSGKSPSCGFIELQQCAKASCGSLVPRQKQRCPADKTVPAAQSKRGWGLLLRTGGSEGNSPLLAEQHKHCIAPSLCAETQPVAPINLDE